MALRFRLLTNSIGSWAVFAPLIGHWSNERLSIAPGEDGPGLQLVATARPTSTLPLDAPVGPGIFALRWFECADPDADEFVDLSVGAWPAFEDGTPGTRIFGLFRTDPAPDMVRFLLCTRYPDLAAWQSSRVDTNTPDFSRRRALTRRTQVSIWRLAGSA
ncbi:MAG: hypothetical protein JJE52_07620 [Acidimicrobiia bacterium]|nr:hypothetical protein [Acidimicrobiia bacterium]